MQEVHCSQKIVHLWESEWGSKWYISSGSSATRGTVIMFNPKFKGVVMKYGCNHEGGNIICNIKLEDCKDEITLCNVYAPNEYSPTFFLNLFKIISKYAQNNLIIGCDFNLAINPELDRHGGQCND